MGNILLITEREYLTRVKKKSFIVMSILGPLLIALVYALPVLLASMTSEEKSIKVYDESRIFNGKFADSKSMKFEYLDIGNLEAEKESLQKSGNALLYIPKIELEKPTGITVFSEKGISVKLLSDMERTIKSEIEGIRLEQSGIDKDILAQVKTKVDIKTVSLSSDGEKDSSVGAATAIGVACGLMIYIFTFLYGAQVLRGVIEEKTNRIVEIIISSVKPFDLMMGKILGIAGVGLTQILLWIVLGSAIIALGSSLLGIDQSQIAQVQDQAEMIQAAQNGEGQAPGLQIFKAISTINFTLIISCFVFYFLFGYLTYAALFGAVGAAVDNETDSQQFMLPVTIPLILAIVAAGAIINDPNGPLAFWMSIFPLTSPIVMMIRLPFTGANWELFLSMGLLILAFLGCTWVAGRIYRVGILMYGKKPTYKELSKWIFYKF